MADEHEPRTDAVAPADSSASLERVSDADRERAADLVQTAASDGRLGLDELDDRLGAVMAARTRGELESALQHLPGADAVIAATQPSKPIRRGEPVAIRGQHSSIRRVGRWDVPAHLVISTKHASVTLDLTEATLPGPEIRLDLDLSHSSLRLVVPDDILVETDDVEERGSNVVVKRPSDSPAPRAAVRLVGKLHWSSVVAAKPGWRRRRKLRAASRRSS